MPSSFCRSSIQESRHCLPTWCCSWAHQGSTGLDGCRIRHYLGDGLITQSVSAWSETFEECGRCLHLQAGSAMFPRLWPVTCRYAATAISVNRWEKTFETAFNGANYALGHLVFIARSFRTNPRLLLMHPALMAGWKIEFGMRYKGVFDAHRLSSFTWRKDCDCRSSWQGSV